MNKNGGLVLLKPSYETNWHMSSMILLQIINLFLQDLQVSPPTVPIWIINCLRAVMDLISSWGNLNLAPWLVWVLILWRNIILQVAWVGLTDRLVENSQNIPIVKWLSSSSLDYTWSVWTFDLNKTNTPRLPVVNLYISQYRSNMRYSITDLSR